MKRILTLLALSCITSLVMAFKLPVNVLIPSDATFPTDTVILFEWTEPISGAYGYDTLKQVSKTRWWKCTSTITKKQCYYSVSTMKRNNVQHTADSETQLDTTLYQSLYLEVGICFEKVETFNTRYAYEIYETTDEATDHNYIIDAATVEGGINYANFDIALKHDTAALFLISLYQEEDKLYDSFEADSPKFLYETSNTEDVTIVKWTIWPMTATRIKKAAEYISSKPFIIEAPSHPSDIVGTENTPSATKFMQNGQLFIQRDGKTYNFLGAKVK